MKILGVDLYDKGMDCAIEEFLEHCDTPPQNLMVSASDAHVLVESKSNKVFHKAIQSFYWNLPDGMPSVWLMKWKGASYANRCSGPDFFKAIIQRSRSSVVRHFLCGGTEETLAALQQTCLAWGNNQIVGVCSPPFRELSETDFETIANQIKTSNANVVWIGLGAPKQIYFAKKLAEYVNVNFMVAVGAAFDFHAGKVKKAPSWIQTIGMEWAYRVIIEPNRLGKRYLRVIPRFLWYAARELAF